eukprot:m.141863 g.141863  ORF g.141863 m.141863 type:complete len:147 (-) comp16705_c2_seq9:175-615(-)
MFFERKDPVEDAKDPRSTASEPPKAKLSGAPEVPRKQAEELVARECVKQLKPFLGSAKIPDKDAFKSLARVMTHSICDAFAGSLKELEAGVGALVARALSERDLAVAAKAVLPSRVSNDQHLQEVTSIKGPEESKPFSGKEFKLRG